MHVCRAFKDPEVIHVEGEVDPVRDLQDIFDELRLKDIKTGEPLLADAEAKLHRTGNKAPKEMRDVVNTLQRVMHRLVVDKQPIRTGDWNTLDVIEIKYDNNARHAPLWESETILSN
jgi:obg-like ATPase 1